MNSYPAANEGSYREGLSGSDLTAAGTTMNEESFVVPAPPHSIHAGLPTSTNDTLPSDQLYRSAGSSHMMEDASTTNHTHAAVPMDDDAWQEIEKELQDVANECAESLRALIAGFHSFYKETTQVAMSWRQIHELELAEARRLDDIEADIAGFTALFHDGCGPTDAHGAAASSSAGAGP